MFCKDLFKKTQSLYDTAKSDGQDKLSNNDE